MGDLNALNQRDASYFDATTMPGSLMESQNLVLRLKDEFYKMPVEVRKLFNNSPEEYVAEMGTNEYLEKMAPYNEKIKAISMEKSAKEYEKKVVEFLILFLKFIQLKKCQKIENISNFNKKYFYGNN